MNRNIEEIQKRIDLLLARQKRVIVAIDGNCTAGKTTLTGHLSQIYDCNVFHMDDFFLRPAQRTPKRFAEVGGNVDYERFREEVLLPLQAGKEFSYRPFQCATFTLGRTIPVQPKQLTIIEGTYSLHPYFGDYSDLKILLTVSPELQRQRILERPAHLHKKFFEEWIPMENRYFSQMQIRKFSDFIL